ncbi:MAG: hypothetical protein ALAOOOJD_00295 [bacterium]|nr:hypothetical protein [bacterium]
METGNSPQSGSVPTQNRAFLTNRPAPIPVKVKARFFYLGRIVLTTSHMNFRADDVEKPRNVEAFFVSPATTIN